MNKRDTLDAVAIKALMTVIILCVAGIIGINMLGTLIQADLLAGIFGDIEQNPDAAINTDEALSILGNVASGATGALAGWLTHGALARKEQEEEEAPTPVVAAVVSPEEKTSDEELVEQIEELGEPEGLDEAIHEEVPDHPDELDEEDPDLVWEDEPIDEDEELTDEDLAEEEQS